MALDLAINGVGDLIMSPSGDIDVRSGIDTIDQRIRIRLKIVQGSWIIDPTNGTLGSQIRNALRMPTNMALQTIPTLVKEALQPMSDEITVGDVDVVVDPNDATQFDLTIFYTQLQSDETQTTTLTIAG